jgi:predicted RNase H-like HicB family nuclease
MQYDNLKAELTVDGWEVWWEFHPDFWDVLAVGKTEQDALDNAIHELTRMELKAAGNL